jgi:hypothetical protein
MTPNEIKRGNKLYVHQKIVCIVQIFFDKLTVNSEAPPRCVNPEGPAV